jgi:hypothetical protein
MEACIGAEQICGTGSHTVLDPQHFCPNRGATAVPVHNGALPAFAQAASLCPALCQLYELQ